jgi:hypothetical protein
MTATRWLLITLIAVAPLQTAHGDNKKGGGTTTTTTPKPAGPVPVPYPNVAKSSIMKSKHNTSKNSIDNIK